MALAVLLVVGVVGAAWFWNRHRDQERWRQIEATLASHDLNGAATLLDGYVQEHPEDAHAWFLAARTARRLERLADAERFLERCQQLRGITASTRLEWDLLQVQKGAIGGIAARLRQSIGPDHPDALLVLEALARGYLRVERLADARQACDLWIARQPDHPWPWLWRGTIHERLNDLDHARLDYQRAVDNAPDDRDARLALGSLLLGQRQPSAAAEHYEHLLGRSPDDPVGQLGLAACRMGQGRVAEAVPLLDHVLEQTPTSPQALFMRGKAALEQDEPARAEPWLRQAIRLSPGDHEAMYQLSLTLRALHKEKEAAEVTRRMNRLRKDHLRLDELIWKIARQPDDAKLRQEAGALALQVGRTEEGVRWLQGLLQMKGDHRATHAILRDHYLEKGDAQRAEYHRSLAETR